MIDSDLCGFLLINKPSGITSYDCIRHIKKLVKTKVKIGHAGTLDPLASGVLIIAIGRPATTCLSELSTLSKTYDVTAKFGENHDTLDSTGFLIDKCLIPSITEKQIQKTLHNMVGTQWQTPPIFSALKHNGKSLHRYARSGKLNDQELSKIAQDKKRKIQIFDINFISWHTPFLQFSANVSKGTYARVLACDIAKKLGTCASTYALIRTSIGKLNIKNAITLKSLNTVKDIQKAFISNLLSEQPIQKP